MPIVLCAQVRGRKRLLLYKPEDLKRLSPYPSWHILRRRCRVDPIAPDHIHFPKFQQVRVLDVLCPACMSMVQASSRALWR